jgi:Secretion system C-terminal sorting domain
MKKIYLLLLLFVSVAAGVNAQCTVNNNDTVLGLSPPDSLLPDIVRNVPYDTVVQVYVPQTFTYSGFTINLVWVVIDTITNAPTGINYARNPSNDTIFAGNHACYQIYGTTSDTAGVYPLTFTGFVRFNTILLNGGQDTTFPLSELSLLSAGSGSSPFAFALRVDNTAGIFGVNNQLQSALQVMPNPNNGQFDIKLNFISGLTGDIRIIDATGRIVYDEPVSSNGLFNQSVNLGNMAKGIYAVQLRTAEGIASKLVSVE